MLSDWDKESDDWGDSAFSNNNAGKQVQPPTTTAHSDYSNAVLPQTPDDTTSIASSNIYNIQKKGPKIFSSKANDSYIMAITTLDVPEADKIYIFQSDHGCYWKPNDSPYTVTIASPKKETKLKGEFNFKVLPKINSFPKTYRFEISGDVVMNPINRKNTFHVLTLIELLSTQTSQRFPIFHFWYHYE